MTIYVDPLMGHGWKLHGHTVHNCHLFSDTAVDELHAFAERIGMDRTWFHDQRIPHYGPYPGAPPAGGGLRCRPSRSAPGRASVGANSGPP